MIVVHGGNVYETASQLGCTPEEILDYSASINPFGPPAGLDEVLAKNYHLLQHYPDIQNGVLLESIARYHGISEDQIVLGNGSTELIYWLPKVLGIRKALIALPTFGEYQKAFELQDVHLARLVAGAADGFQPTIEELDELVGQFAPEAILLTHPGSPSGTLLPPSVRHWLVKKSRSGDVFGIIDEVFVDFCEEESHKHFLVDSEGLLIIRSMTKFYGLPGLRIGYLMTSKALAARLRHFLPPWSVNTYAQVSVPYCLNQEEYREKTREFISHERGRLIKLLQSLEGCQVFPGKANYLLVRLGEHLPPAGKLRQDLLTSDRILIRDCHSFEGLDDHYVRLAIRLPEQNQRLFDAMVRWVKAHAH